MNLGDKPGIVLFRTLDGTVTGIHGDCRMLSGSHGEECQEQPERWNSLIKPDDMQRLQAFFDRNPLGVSRHTIQYKVKTSVNGWRTIHSELTGVKNGAGGFLGYICHDTVIEPSRSGAESLFHLIFRASPDVVAISRVSDGTFVDMNDEFSRLLGVEREEAIGKTSVELGIWKDNAHRQAYIERLKKTGTVHNAEVEFRTKFGKVLTSLISSTIIDWADEPYMLSVVRDISRRRQTELRLERSEELYRSLIETMNDGLVIREGDHITLVNDKFCEMLQHGKLELLGSRMDEYLTAESRTRLQELLVSESYRESIELRWRRRNGEILTTLSSLQRVQTDSGTRRATFLVVTDISMQKEIEEQLRVLTEQLTREHKELEEKNIALRQVLSTIEDEKRDIRNRILGEIEQEVMPSINRMSDESGEVDIDRVTAVKEKLSALLEDVSGGFEQRLKRLTPRELEICEMIRDGMTTKEISEALHLSPLTVNKHRELIRKKLEIQNKDVNLSTYLRIR